MAMNYGGRDELRRAVTRIVADAQRAEEPLSPQDISEELISSYLDTANMPDPDFVVRTSGEQRLSGYLLWQLEYAELWFPEFSFPEFTPEKLDEAIEEFERRQRRFGK
jgi:undecaprenyl diphosphate synthase